MNRRAEERRYMEGGESAGERNCEIKLLTIACSDQSIEARAYSATFTLNTFIHTLT